VKEQLLSLEGLPSGEESIASPWERHISNLVGVTRAVGRSHQVTGAAVSGSGHGNHGGATSEGQRKILENWFYRSFLAFHILSSMEVVRLGEVEGIPIHLTSMLINPTDLIHQSGEPHQFFKGEIQSGIEQDDGRGLARKKGRTPSTAPAGQITWARSRFHPLRTPILFGVALLETYDETRRRPRIDSGTIQGKRSVWVKQSRELILKSPSETRGHGACGSDGKDISGSGMDTNGIGFTRRTRPVRTNVAVPLAVLDLTGKSDGNAMRIGLLTSQPQGW